MRIGIIDLGTNSIRFDVYDWSDDGQLVRVLRERELVRLGDSVFTTQHITEEAARRVLDAFKKFKAQGDSAEVTNYVAVGTSALRDAKNREEFIAAVKKETGIQLRVITGDEEAALIAKGVISNEKLTSDPVAIVDIGGGSTEIIVALGESVFHSTSFNLGTLRLQQVYLKTHPPKVGRDGSGSPINELRHAVRSSLSATIVRQGWPGVKRVVGASGTIRALTRIAKNFGDKTNSIEQETLSKLIERMSTMTISQLLEIPGMESKRVDIILGGAILLDEILDVFRVKRCHGTEFSLRDGLIIDVLDKIRDGNRRLI